MFEPKSRRNCFRNAKRSSNRNEAAYKNSVLRARELVKQGFLVTFGIKPSDANTGYGYIEANGEDVLKFHEKPELAAAQRYIAAGNFYWNNGMFMFKTGVFLNELKAQSPEISDRTIATIDVDDLNVVDTKDTLLIICKKGSSQKVKQVVELLKDNDLIHSHVTTHRPWGTYTVLEDESGYKIKRIVVKPGKRLSFQKHYHRNEHWIVVSGTATVTIGERNFLLRENESTFIKMGEIHRLENEGKIPVVLIEAQVGSYTGEDDIVRIEDDFNRN